MKKFFILIIMFFFPLIISANEFKIDYEKNLLEDVSFQNIDKTFNAIIEIPTGTNEKWEVNKNGKSLQREFNGGLPRTINYLSYPGNYGFIPQTLLSKENGGDGDALDVVILGEKLTRGSVVKIEIVGMLSMKDKGLVDNKIIAVLAGSKFSNSISKLQNFKKNYPGVLKIIEIWFKNYKGQKIETFGFLEKKIAKEFIINANKNFIKIK